MNVFLFDMGLPMIFPSIMLMVIGLIPIVFVEAYVMRTELQIETQQLLAPVAIANLVSTFIGIPVTWFLLMLLEFASASVFGAVTDRNPWDDVFSFTLGAPWIVPGLKNENWIILGAMLFLLIPYGLASWVVEYVVIKTIFTKKQDEAVNYSASLKDLKFSVGKANLISYCLLAVFVILIWSTAILRSS